MTTDICTEDVIVQLTSPQGNNAGNRLAAGTNGSEMGRKLLLAAKNGDTNTVLSLMAAGAPFSTDWLGTSALHLAAGAGHAHTAAVLLRAGSVRDARTKVERTPLHVAASGGHSDVVTLLLQHGAAVDCRDMLRMTPLHWAAQRGHAAAAAALLAARADHTATDKFGHTAAALAARAGHAELAAALALAPTTHHTKPEKAESNLPVFESVPKVQEIPSMPEAKKAKPNPPSEGIKIKPEPGIEFFNTGQEAGVGAGAGSGVGAGAALLARHGITLQPRDQHCTVLSALRCGRSLVLSDAGKLVLKESAAVSSSGAESAAASLQQAAPPPAPAPAPSPHNKLMFSPTHNLTVGNVQVKYVQIPKDTKIISPRKEVMIKAKPRPMLVNYNQLCSSNKKEMLRQPVKIIMNKANFKKLISNKNTTALNVVESGSGSGAAAAAAGAGAAAGADSGQLRAELAAARVAIARLTHELANARDQLAHRHS